MHCHAWFYMVLGIKLRAWCEAGKTLTTETQLQPVCLYLPKDRAWGSELCISWLTVSRSPRSLLGLLHVVYVTSVSAPFSLARVGKAWMTNVNMNRDVGGGGGSEHRENLHPHGRTLVSFYLTLTGFSSFLGPISLRVYRL